MNGIETLWATVAVQAVANVARGSGGPDGAAGAGHAAGAGRSAAEGRQGTWSAERRGDRIQLEMSMSWDGGHHSWSNGETSSN